MLAFATECRRLLRASAKRILLEIKESDAAASNGTWVSNTDVSAREPSLAAEGKILSVHQFCLLHQLYLCVGLNLSLVGGPKLPVISLLYCTSRVLRSPGYWDTLLVHVPRAVRLILVIKDSGWSSEFRSANTILYRCQTVHAHVTSTKWGRIDSDGMVVLKVDSLYPS